MKQTEPRAQFVVCVKNEGYAASLELRKIYRTVPDTRDAEHRLIRVIDESGEGYLYPVDYFVPIELPQAAESAFSPTPDHSLERASLL
jgi:hypothetical protein